MELPLKELPSPSYVVSEERLKKNLLILDSIQERTGANILLALKGYAMWRSFELIQKHLKGVACSSLNEVLLGKDKFNGEIHLCAPGMIPSEFNDFLKYCDHIVFNSFDQWFRFKSEVENFKGKVKCGLRINPEHSEGAVAIYDPCSKGSRLGIRRSSFEGKSLEGITGLHFHTLCEQNSDAFERTLEVVVHNFGSILENMEWVNFGGGHHMTRSDYDVERLVRVVNVFHQKFPHLKMIFEPGEAIALNTGFLVCEVLDLLESDGNVAILDTSASAHMPDVLEMPYRPMIIGSGLAGEKKYTYRLGGMTCLAGDVIGEYSFDLPLQIGQRLVFTDMAHYTMVKNTMFNGINLPSIVYLKEDNTFEVVRRFGYEDFKNRLS